MNGVRGPIALVGGAEWHPPAMALDEWLIASSGSRIVTVLPTAAANERPERAVEFARNYFKDLDAEVEGVMVLDREHAEEESNAEKLRSSALIYIAGGDPRVLARILRDTAAWRAIVEANAGGAVLAGSSAGAMILCDRMVWPSDTKGEEGLGFFKGAAVLPHHDQWKEKVAPLVEATKPDDFRLIGIDECTALIVEPGRCRVLGAGSVTMYRRGNVIWSAEAPAEMESECL